MKRKNRIHFGLLRKNKTKKFKRKTVTRKRKSLRPRHRR